MKNENLVNESVFDLRKEHKAVHQTWNKNAISILYVGEEDTGTAEVKANSLELAAPALTVVADIDLTAAAYNTLAELVAHINGLADWECTLGDQFDGTEASASLTVVGAADVKTAPVVFVQDAHLQIKVVLPAVATGKRVNLTGIVSKSTYGSGTSALKIYNGDTLVWQEDGGATTVEAQDKFDKITIDAGEQATIKLVNSAAMTAGYLSVNYEERDFEATPLSI